MSRALFQLLESFSSVVPGALTCRAFLEVSSRILFLQLHVRDPVSDGTAPVVSRCRLRAGRSAALAVGGLDDLEICSAEVGSTTARRVRTPHRVHGERRGAGAVEARRAPGEDVLLAADLDELVEDASVRDPPSAIPVKWGVTGALPRLRRTGHQLHQVDDLDVLLAALLGERRSDQTQAETSVSISSAFALPTRRRLISAVRSGRSIPQTRAGSRAVTTGSRGRRP